jgi:hypothetical protein
VTLALAVAALLLAGCGGGSSEDASNTSASSTPASGASKSASADSASPGAESKAAGKAGEGASGAQGAPGSGSAGHPAAEGQKHGPRITAPKGPPEQAPSAEQVAHATVADITRARLRAVADRVGGGYAEGPPGSAL